MTLQPLPTDFVLSHVSLTWREILWGYDHGWINCKGLTELATRRLTTNDPTPPAEVELAGLVVGESSRARALAEEFKLPNATRKDSQGICFLGKIPFDEFLKHHLGEKRGKLIDIETGKVMGEHPGFWYFTIGQREGIGLSGGPWYVVKKDTENNVIYIGHQAVKEAQATDRIRVTELNWFNEKPDDGAELRVKLRHGPKEYRCTVQWESETILEVFLDEKDPGVAAGQYAVFYAGDYCLGGGVIASVLR